MYRCLNLGSRKILIRPYTTKIELDVLEVFGLSEYDLTEDDYESMVNDILRYCVKNLSELDELSKNEKILIVWYARAITLGNDIGVDFVCPGCGKRQRACISLADMIHFPTRCAGHIKPRIVSDTEFGNIKKEDVLPPDMDIEEFESIDLFDYHLVYAESMILRCPDCGLESPGDFLTYKQCLSFLSEDSFQSLTKWIHVLVYSDNLSRSDILEMTPIERMLEIEYFNEQLKVNEKGAEHE